MNLYSVLLVDDEEEVYSVIMKNLTGKRWDFVLPDMQEMVWKH